MAHSPTLCAAPATPRDADARERSATRSRGEVSKSLYGDPDELDHLALQIGRSADEVRDRARGMDTQASAMRWKSVAAQRARQTVRDDRHKLDEAARRLDEAAVLLRRHAQEVREIIAMISRIEQEVVHWVTGEPPEPPKEPWQGWPYQPENLPPSGDKQWLQVGEFMRKQGAI